DAGDRHHAALGLLTRARGQNAVLTLQTLGELFNALTRRIRMPAPEAMRIVNRYRRGMPIVAADATALQDAMDAVSEHNLSFWDAMLWATARSAGCRLLITEDGQHGRVLGGVTFVNPFAPNAASLLLPVFERR